MPAVTLQQRLRLHNSNERVLFVSGEAVRGDGGGGCDVEGELIATDELRAQITEALKRIGHLLFSGGNVARSLGCETLRQQPPTPSARGKVLRIGVRVPPNGHDREVLRGDAGVARRVVNL